MSKKTAQLLSKKMGKPFRPKPRPNLAFEPLEPRLLLSVSSAEILALQELGGADANDSAGAFDSLADYTFLPDGPLDGLPNQLNLDGVLPDLGSAAFQHEAQPEGSEGSPDSDWGPQDMLAAFGDRSAAAAGSGDGASGPMGHLPDLEGGSLPEAETPAGADNLNPQGLIEAFGQGGSPASDPGGAGDLMGDLPDLEGGGPPDLETSAGNMPDLEGGDTSGDSAPDSGEGATGLLGNLPDLEPRSDDAPLPVDEGGSDEGSLERDFGPLSVFEAFANRQAPQAANHDGAMNGLMENLPDFETGDDPSQDDPTGPELPNLGLEPDDSSPPLAGGDSSDSNLDPENLLDAFDERAGAADGGIGDSMHGLPNLEGGNLEPAGPGQGAKPDDPLPLRDDGESELDPESLFDDFDEREADAAGPDSGMDESLQGLPNLEGGNLEPAGPEQGARPDDPLPLRGDGESDFDPESLFDDFDEREAGEAGPDQGMDESLQGLPNLEGGNQIGRAHV